MIVRPLPAEHTHHRDSNQLWVPERGLLSFRETHFREILVEWAGQVALDGRVGRILRLDDRIDQVQRGTSRPRPVQERVRHPLGYASITFKEIVLEAIVGFRMTSARRCASEP